MFHARRSAVPSWRNVFAMASSILVANCSATNGSEAAEPAVASTSAAPVLRTANSQQTFGSGSTAATSSSDATNPGSLPAGPASSTPVASSEAQKDPILVSPDAGANGSVPPAAQPSPSAAPQPSNAPSVPSDDDDDDEEDDD